MFKEERKEPQFRWEMLGDIALGRPNLGKFTSVAIYRLMQYTLRDILITEYGVEKAELMVQKAGEIGGRLFYRNLLTKKNSFNDLVHDIQEKMKDLQIGIFRVEYADIQTNNYTFTVAEDIDCSGLPIYSEEICTYDEGFLSGILSEFTGIDFDVKEIDCWCSGDRVCRFVAKPKK